MDIKTATWSGLWVLLAGALLLHTWRYSGFRTPARVVWSAIFILALGSGWGGVNLLQRTTTDPATGTVMTTRTTRRYLPGVASTRSVFTDEANRPVGGTVTLRIVLPVVFLVAAALYAALTPPRRYHEVNTTR